MQNAQAALPAALTHSPGLSWGSAAHSALAARSDAAESAARSDATYSPTAVLAVLNAALGALSEPELLECSRTEYGELAQQVTALSEPGLLECSRTEYGELAQQALLKPESVVLVPKTADMTDLPVTHAVADMTELPVLAAAMHNLPDPEPFPSNHQARQDHNETDQRQKHTKDYSSPMHAAYTAQLSIHGVSHPQDLPDTRLSRFYVPPAQANTSPVHPHKAHPKGEAREDDVHLPG
jgi:hypothetical protein